MPTALESLSVDCHGLALHVRQRNPAGSPAVLFLHGWLDHSHSFDAMLEHLPDAWRLALLDFRGMGRSAHLPRGAHYHFTDYLLDVEAAVDGLGLGPVYLVGHSLGGIIATAYAAARPERVRGLLLIESLGPTGGAPTVAVERLRGLLEDSARPPHRKPYPSVEAAAARLRENNPSLTPEAAHHLALHGTEPRADGLVFRFDPAHRRRFGYGYDEAQWLAVARTVACPVRMVFGSDGLPFDSEPARERLAALRAPPPVVLPGGHHLHMEKPREVASVLVDFLR
ncbi:alpha/beta hydrolase [Myxococcaceae bacterium GXIMD 01537]